MTGGSALDPARAPYHPERAFAPREALAAATSGAAFAGGFEHAYGRIAPGRYANVAVLDRDPLVGDPGELLTASTILTLVHGEVAYRAPHAD